MSKNAPKIFNHEDLSKLCEQHYLKCVSTQKMILVEIPTSFVTYSPKHLQDLKSLQFRTNKWQNMLRASPIEPWDRPTVTSMCRLSSQFVTNFETESGSIDS